MRGARTEKTIIMILAAVICSILITVCSIFAVRVNTSDRSALQGSEGRILSGQDQGRVDTVADTVYTIDYNYDGGIVSAPNPTTYTISTPTFILNKPTKEGYDFVGWVATVDGIQIPDILSNVSITQGSTGNRKYLAYWTAAKYTITYILGEGGTAVNNPTEYTILSDTFKLNNPTRPGYQFVGWQGTGITGTSNLIDGVTVEQGSSGNRKYTAVWTLRSFQISYELDGGNWSGVTTNPNPSYLTVEDDAVTIVNPTKLGYTFGGWMNETFEAPIKNLVLSKLTQTLALRAVWEKNVDEISYTEGGSENALIRITTLNGFDPKYTIGVSRIMPETLTQNTIASLADNEEVKSAYRLSLVGDPYTGSMQVYLYGALPGYRLVVINDDGSISEIEGLITDGDYFVFTTNALQTYAVVGQSSNPIIRWEQLQWYLLIGGGAVVGLFLIFLLLKFTILRRHKIVFKGAPVEPLKLKKGKTINLPSGYFWFEDENCTIPFMQRIMPKHNLTLYTSMDERSRLAYSMATAAVRGPRSPYNNGKDAINMPGKLGLPSAPQGMVAQSSAQGSMTASQYQQNVMAARQRAAMQVVGQQTMPTGGSSQIVVEVQPFGDETVEVNQNETGQDAANVAEQNANSDQVVVEIVDPDAPQESAQDYQDTQGEYQADAYGQYDNGQYNNGQYDGQYDSGQYDDGQYAQNQYYDENNQYYDENGQPYQSQDGTYEGQYAQDGQYYENGQDGGQYAEGAYDGGQYGDGYNGEYVDGTETGYADDGSYNGEYYDNGGYQGDGYDTQSGEGYYDDTNGDGGENVIYMDNDGQ